MKNEEGGKKREKEIPDGNAPSPHPTPMSFTEAASCNVPASEGIVQCEDWIRLRSNKDMRRHTVDNSRFGMSLEPI